MKSPERVKPHRVPIVWLAAAILIALQQAVLFALLPSFVHRVWCAWSGAIAVTFALADLGLAAFAPAAVTAAFAAVWLAELDHAKRGEMLRAGGYGLGLAAVQTAVVQGFFLAMVLGLLEHLGTKGAFIGEVIAMNVEVGATPLRHRPRNSPASDKIVPTIATERHGIGIVTDTRDQHTVGAATERCPRRICGFVQW